MKHFLQTLDPLLAIAAGAGLLLLIAFMGWARQSRRAHKAELEITRLEAIAVKGQEILAASPDGLFLWDHVLGGIVVSRRLAVLLNLEAGTHSRFDDIRSRFTGDELKALEQGCSALRGNGTSFDLVLSSNERIIHTIGQRADTESGEILADLVWMRDITDTSLNSSTVETAPATETPDSFDDRHLTALLDALPIPVWIRDSNLNLAFANIAATDIAGASIDLAERAKTISAPVGARRLINQDVQPTPMDLNEIPLESMGGGTLGYAIDRSESEPVTKPTPGTASAQTAVLEELSTAIAIFNSTTRLEFSNAAYHQLWDLDPAWLSQGPNIGEVLEKLREQRKLPEVTNFRTFKEEEIARFRAMTEPLTEMMHLPDGRSIRHRIAPNEDGGLIHTFDDKSEDLNLKRSFNELGAVQLETLDNLHEGVAVFGSDGRLQLHNPIYAQLWEISEDKLEDQPHLTNVLDFTRAMVRPPADLNSWTDEAWAAHKALVTARLLSRTQRDGQITLRNGTVVVYANVPLPDGAVLLSYQDVTDSARIEQALRERAQALEDANTMKSQFIADVAREIRTPLNTVIGFSDMLEQEFFGDLNTRQEEYTRGIADTSRSLMAVVDNILDLAEMDAGQIDLDMGSMDIHGTLAGAFKLVIERARRKDIKLKFECSPDIGWMIGDSNRIKQAIYKLLSNSLTYTPPHGSVMLRGERKGKNIKISVIDTGIGIPKGDKERIFIAFDKGSQNAPANSSPPGIDPSDSGRGVGLGLTIVKRFIERHGGTIDIRSQIGRGTTVTCQLPASNRGKQIINAMTQLENGI